MCSVHRRPGAEGTTPRPESQGAGQSLQDGLAYLQHFLQTLRGGKKSCFEVKLLEHHLRDLMSVWRHQGARDEKPGQRLGALASQPAACTQEAPNSGALQTEGSPAASCSPADRRPVQRRGAGSRGWRPLYLSNASQLLNIVAGVVFFFFSILFKLKLSKVEPDKSEGCRGSGLSFLRLMTSAKDNTQLWVKCQQGQRSHQG